MREKTLPSTKRMQSPARLLIIAGSDSGGGAGIQADIKTATVLGAYAMTAVTAVTVQDTRGVHGVYPIPPKVVADQVAHVLDDIGADAIKTGMIVSADTVEAVSKALARHPSVPLVVDTVMTAKGGTALLDDAGVEAVRQLLFPRAALVTPNAPEAARLTGLPVETPEDLLNAAQALHATGVRAVLAKGGHLAGDTVTDVLVEAGGIHIFRTRRIDNPSTHGTGCTLATAIAASLAQGFALEDAVVRARSFVHEAIRTGLPFGRGTGPLNHLHAIAPYQE